MTTINSEPYPWPYNGDLRPENTALVVIDMQIDFCGKGGYVDSMGYDLSHMREPIEPIRNLFAALRPKGYHIFHTREGHRPDLSDAPPAKLSRGAPEKRIGDVGPMGRILIRGEPGHDIIEALSPLPGEPVIDKPGKGAFHQTDLEQMLRNRGIDTLIMCGVTTEVCVHTTIREANDRGYRCVAIGDACASYFPEFHRAGLEMIKAQGGIFGWVSDSKAFVDALNGGKQAA
jgi:nicotinamidase-related amidase